MYLVNAIILNASKIEIIKEVSEITKLNINN